nr:MAG TPA: hypothetical protein [Caudoviricetes sp.]
MLKATLTVSQFRALEGLAYWIADEKHIKTEFGEDEPELQHTRETIKACFDELDKLKVPFWVQNTAIMFGQNLQRYKTEYIKEYMKTKNITVGA